jgi:hypothetical protein
MRGVNRIAGRVDAAMRVHSPGLVAGEPSAWLRLDSRTERSDAGRTAGMRVFARSRETWWKTPSSLKQLEACSHP